MDYDKLIEVFKQLEFVAYNYNINGEVLGMDCTEFESVMADAATAIEALRADLARVKAERDAAVKCIEEIEDALNFQRISAIGLRLSKWRGQKED